MKKLLVCAEDSLSIIRIERLLNAKNQAFDCVKSPIRKDDLLRYRLLIIHSSWRLANLYQFIEQLVISKTIPVIFITPNISIAPFTKIISLPYFTLVDEGKLDSELPITIDITTKFIQEFEKLQLEVQSSKNKLELSKLMDECKKSLMAKGLSEPEAHSAILKLAMDAHISKYDACLRILNENKTETS